MEANLAPPGYEQDKIAPHSTEPQYEEEGLSKPGEVHDAFGNEEYAEIKYKTLKWWYVLPYPYSYTLGIECLHRIPLGNAAYS